MEFYLKLEKHTGMKVLMKEPTLGMDINVNDMKDNARTIFSICRCRLDVLEVIEIMLFQVLCTAL